MSLATLVDPPNACHKADKGPTWPCQKAQLHYQPWLVMYGCLAGSQAHAGSIT